MPPQDKGKRTKTQGTPEGNVGGGIKALREEIDQLRAMVRKHNDILQVQDNWHSRISRMLKKDVYIKMGGSDEWLYGKLLWTDRYNIGVEICGSGNGTRTMVEISAHEEIINKGHIARMKLAEE